jgi:EAL and modified HD-GYP domain-containing signal transduction protein
MQTAVLLARQPILDKEQRLVAYELLARSEQGCVPVGQRGSVTTAGLLIDALTEFGLDRLVGSVPAFVNMTREFLVGESPLPLPPDRIVIEVLEDIEPDRATIEGIGHLKRAGFRIALDDYTGPRRGYEPFLELADVIKVDCLDRGPLELENIVKSLRPYPALLLAEKVEDASVFRVCLSLGFRNFQGYFFARPELTRAKALGADRANLMHLMAELHDPDASVDELEQILSRDPVLSLKLIRYLNSASSGLAREIGTVREVLIYLGPATVRDIASLILLSRCDDKPRQLMLTAMMRARLCQQLAFGARSPNAPRAFMVGLFSTLDAVLDLEIDTALNSLPLATDIREAILLHRGELGSYLLFALAIERGNWAGLVDLGLSDVLLNTTCLEAADWVTKMERELSLYG